MVPCKTQVKRQDKSWCAETEQARVHASISDLDKAWCGHNESLTLVGVTYGFQTANSYVRGLGARLRVCVVTRLFRCLEATPSAVNTGG